EISFQ
ncbi:hypothetical protein ECEC1870_1704, partial [Escherichia coli EC1870]